MVVDISRRGFLGAATALIALAAAPEQARAILEAPAPATPDNAVMRHMRLAMWFKDQGFITGPHDHRIGDRTYIATGAHAFNLEVRQDYIDISPSDGFFRELMPDGRQLIYASAEFPSRIGFSPFFSKLHNALCNETLVECTAVIESDHLDLSRYMISRTEYTSGSLRSRMRDDFRIDWEMQRVWSMGDR